MNQGGRLIVVEGIDGAGKTTLCDKLVNEYDLHYMTQPENSWVGDVARKALREDVEPGCDLFLHMAAHANQQPRIKENLQNSDVIMDRYFHSRVAYQSVQSQFSEEFIYELHTGWSIEPTFTILLDIPADEALRRKAGNRDKFEGQKFLTEVRSTYLDFFGNHSNVIIVDGTKSKDELYNEVSGNLF